MSHLTRHRSSALGFFCLGVTALFLAGFWVESLIAERGQPPWALLRAENYLKDTLERDGRKAPVNPNLVFLGIDESSISLEVVSDEEKAASLPLRLMSAGYPWNRAVYGMITDRLADAGAAAIIFDLLFPTSGESDAAFKDAIDRHRDRVILAGNFDFPNQDDRRAVWSLPASTLMPDDRSHKVRIGFVNYLTDSDGIIRRSKFAWLPEDFSNGAFDQDSVLNDSTAAATLRQIGRPGLIPGRQAPIRFPGDAGTFPAQPVYQIFVPAFWNANYKNGAYFRGKIVIVGPAGGFHHDSHPTPLGDSVPGPEIHLDVLNAALQGEFLRETPFFADLALVAIAGLCAWVIGVTVRQPALRFLVLAGASALAMAVWWILYNRFGILTAMATPLFVLNGSGGVCMVYDFVLERVEKGRFRRTLERYVSKNVVGEILDNPKSFIHAQGGMRRPVALLFTDLRGFTSMTEEADSGQLVAQLNEYFTQMVQPVFANEGTLDKFIGDAIMAVWGNVVDRGAVHDVRMAVKTALDMQESLARLNKKWAVSGIRPFAMGIGINHGLAVAGNIGSSEKMEFTVIGDVVNLASRIEGLTKAYHVQILVGEEAVRHVRDLFYFQTVDLVQVVGKTKAVKVSTVHGPRSETLPDAMRAYLKRYEEGIALYEGRGFDSALGAFEECLRLRPNDFLADIYRTRCMELAKSPPDETWSGVFVMTKK